jgi:hypothetical protein
VLYATTVVILSFLVGWIRIHVRRAGLIDPSRARELVSQRWLIAPAVFLASIPVAFVNTTLAKYLWLLLLVPVVVPRLRARAARRNQ